MFIITICILCVLMFILQCLLFVKGDLFEKREVNIINGFTLGFAIICAVSAVCEIIMLWN